MHKSSGNLLEPVFAAVIRLNTSDEVNAWLHEKAEQIRKEQNAAQLQLAFAAVPRKTGRQIIQLTEAQRNEIEEICELVIDNWSVDRLSRIWLVLQVNAGDKENYVRKLKDLFKSAEMNELAALYAGLIVFDYPCEWQTQCTEGIRSNIGIVLEAIMYNNPWPSKYLSEPAWNQLILKAFFTDKDVTRIRGLDERANKELAAILIDYARERRAAHRTVNPQLWRLVSPFIDAANFDDIKIAFSSNDISKKKAAALACYHSNYPPAKQLLHSEPNLLSAIADNSLNWKSLQQNLL